MPTYYYSIPYHYYNTWMIGDYVIDDFGNSVEVPSYVYGVEDYELFE